MNTQETITAIESAFPDLAVIENSVLAKIKKLLEESLEKQRNGNGKPADNSESVQTTA